jgi:hypothetical protein
MNERGGFDAVITNPPWEVFQTDAKEFFSEYSDVVYKRKMNVLDFEDKKEELLGDPEIREAWLDYCSRFSHPSAYFKKTDQYKHQGSGKINLYKLFVEQCYNLLRFDGTCGIVIPASFYIDADKKDLRKLLFTEARIRGLFCFENKGIFEEVDSRFKFIVLTFEKGGTTETFPAAFMRTDVSELIEFPEQHSVQLSVPMIRRLSPNMLAITEFTNQMDIQIADKMSQYPLLGQKVQGKWNLRLTTEFDKTANKDLFELTPSPRNVPLYSGSMVHYFDHQYAHPQYYIDLEKGKARRAGRLGNKGGDFACEHYRLIQRRITGQTNERSLISAVIPKNCFCDNSCNYVLPNTYSTERELLFITSVFSSFVADYWVRRQVNTNITIGVVKQLPIPRLTESDPAFAPLVERAARLICTTPAYDDLARAVGLGNHTHGVTDPAHRARLRAELDGLIAHVYGLTEEEFRHILDTFPLVEEQVKADALAAYRENGG